MKKKLKERKKKEKERKTQKQLLWRREYAIKKKKKDRSIDKDVRANRDKIEPIISPEKEKLRKQQQLERNLQMLKGLEEEYKKEQENRKKLNEKLEAEGAMTLKEKMVPLP